MKRLPARRQRGAALLILCVIVVAGMAWLLVNAVSNAAQRGNANREYNARVLAEAKTALIGWIATNALLASESNPGRLPCPQTWTDVNTANEGRAAGNCAAPAVGLLPWRELGLPRVLDASGNQLWYVVSPGWHLPDAVSTLDINSNTSGSLTVSGQSAVALIIAPGQAVSVTPNANQIAAGCSARTQTRDLTSPATTDVRDYLECQNATTADYTYATAIVDNGSNPVFNDQVLAITTADILPVLEGAIAKRIERDIAPALKTVYAAGTFGISGQALYPYPVDFSGNPGPNGCPSAACAGTSNYQGSSAKLEGLLPFNQTQGCTVQANDPRCTTSFLAFSKTADGQTSGSGTIRTQSSCSWASNVWVCTGQYNAPSISLQTTVTVTNVAMGLRKYDSSKVTCTAVDDVGAGLPTQTVACSIASAVMQNNGSVTLTINVGPMPDVVASGWGTYANYMINLDRAVFADHSLLSTDAVAYPTTSWFARNEWYRLTYYAVAKGRTAQVLNGAPKCPTTIGGSYAFDSSCLSVTNVSPANTQAAMLILAGRSINGAPRPSSTLGDYLEGTNKNGTGTFVKQTVSTASVFNDRVIVVDSN
jgi:hypothetical protein